MSQAGNGLTQSESDVLAGVLSGQSCHVVLVSSPPSYVKKISKYLESSEKLDGRCEAPNEASSDSGDSLFLTQKPEPEAVRPKRRRSTHFSHTGDLIDEDDASSSSSDGESRTAKKKKVVYRLPKFFFPFLQKGKNSQEKNVSAHRNKKLHHFAMGGFFKCVQEEQECRNRNLTASLPTIDREGEHITEISEPEEERTVAEDIQVVERKRFVVSLKAKSFQPWYEPRETCSEEKQQTEGAQNSGSESQSHRQRMEEAIAARRRLFSSRAKSCDEGDSSHGGMKDEAGDTSRIQTERADKSLKRIQKKLILLPNVNANPLCEDSDATVCDADADKRFGSNTEPFTKAAECEHVGPDLLQNDPADDSLCESTKKRKKKKNKGVDEDLSLEEESMGTSVQKNIHDLCSPETQTMTEQMVTKKKKRREKRSDDTNGQCESARKKDEKRAFSFHQQEQGSPDDSSQKPAGSTSDVTAQSAEITASSEEHDTRRKKKKRSAVQLSEDRDSEEPRETCQSSPSVAIKKKRKLEESSESAADAEPAQTQQSEVPWKKKKKTGFQHSNI
ncbi:hypothetical protein OJAV_G00137040 [Oryzias javanicus]|uniref:Uncharacterized protein n=1 Tax=Oryzias javanicus TaxID=123683 RepID=A0A437CM73_ORYJA|nr:hypothetical protein OJAV_G00137040 [Oryzias javanicus]